MRGAGRWASDVGREVKTAAADGKVLRRCRSRRPSRRGQRKPSSHLNGRAPDAPPPEHPISSQVTGELRELRVRFAHTRYRILYQRSANFCVLLHGFEKNTGSIPQAEIDKAIVRMKDFHERMDADPGKPPRAVGRDAPPRNR